MILAARACQGLIAVKPDVASSQPRRAFLLVGATAMDGGMWTRRNWNVLCGRCAICGKNPARLNRKDCDSCSDKNKAASRRQRLRLASKGLCRSCGVIAVPPGKSHCETCYPRYQEQMRRYSQNQRAKVLDHYGCRCACPGCNETEPMFLTIDHVNGNGTQHRKEIGARQIYKAIIDSGFPDTYQILCYNCNCGRWRNGGVCPHIRKGEAACD